MNGSCVNCGRAAGTERRDRCDACYVYRWRTGRERPIVQGRLYAGRLVATTCAECGRPRNPHYGTATTCGRCYDRKRGRAVPV
jgi:hypothetical protein